MVEIVDIGFEEFRKQMKDVSLYIWGAGSRANQAAEVCDGLNIQAFIDNNVKCIGKIIEYNGNKYPVIGVEEFKVCMNEKIENLALLILPVFYTKEIINQLNNMQESHGLKCYLWNFMSDKIETPQFKFTDGKQIIPKKIHYFWVGGNAIPELQQKCIDSWKKMCPDYEIIKWDETNYDFTKNGYMYQAYKHKKWGFVPDYARFDVIYEHGGIYLDTDVELLKNLDDFLCDEMFCAFMNEFVVGTGVGFGAVKGNWLVKKMRDYYNHISFINEDSTLNITPSTQYQDVVLKENGFIKPSQYQKKDGVVIYPAGVFLSRYTSSTRQKITDSTVAIHHGTGTWQNEKQRKNLVEWKEIAEYV